MSDTAFHTPDPAPDTPASPQAPPAKVGIFARFWAWWVAKWRAFGARHPSVAQFVLFFVVSQGVTLLQFVLMPVFRAIFGATPLINIAMQVLPLGKLPGGSTYYMFDYAAGPIQADGTGGGLAYFLAVQIVIALAQVVNFFLQRRITFEANNNPWYAAMWYAIAYVAITFVAAALQGLYKAPLYSLLMDQWGWGSAGETTADVLTMLINSTISFWVFFPIFKLIFVRVEPTGDWPQTPQPPAP